MKKGITIYFLIAVFSLAGGVGHAGPLTIPNTFVSGTKAKAAEVNANFQAVKNAIDNNDARISSLEAGFGTGILDVYNNADVTINGTDCNVLSITVNATRNGWIALTGSGYFYIPNHVSGTADAPRVSLTTVSGTMNTTDNYFTLFSIPGSLPSGAFYSPFSITGVFPVPIGTTTYYMVADVYDGAGFSSSAVIGHRQLTGILFIPNK